MIERFVAVDERFAMMNLRRRFRSSTTGWAIATPINLTQASML